MLSAGVENRQVSAGAQFTLVLQNDGVVLGAGRNNRGQLGDGTRDDRSIAVRSEGYGSGNLQVAAGTGTSVVLKGDGAVWACGQNTWGELGDGTTESRANPAPMLIVGNGNRKVAAGEYHVVVLRGNGEVYSTGANRHGQLGDGTVESTVTPVKMLLPVDVLAVDIDAGCDHTIILAADGSVWGCGRNDFGQLGDGTNQRRVTPVRMTVVGSANLEIATGALHSTVLRDDGSVLSTGWNGYGQLGTATSESSLVPMRMAAPVSIARQISCGAWSTHVIADSGAVYSTGSQVFGQQGNPDADCPTPIRPGSATPGCSTPTRMDLVGSANRMVSGGTGHVVVLKSRRDSQGSMEGVDVGSASPLTVAAKDDSSMWWPRNGGECEYAQQRGLRTFLTTVKS